MPIRPNPHKGESPSSLAGQLEEMFNIVGSSMMSADFAGKLLAFLYKYGGGMEAVTLHKGLNAGIMIAQEKFNIKGGSVPLLEGVRELQLRIRELNAEKEDLSCPWLWEIYLRYGLDTKGLKSKCPDEIKEKYKPIK